MIRIIIYSIFFLLLLTDIGYSFFQHLSQPLDGDMAWNIVPANDVKPILESPFGTGVIFKNQTYPNPNRFFCHWIFKEYFEKVPILLQKLVQPIDSIYLSCAIAKILIQTFLIFLISIAITGTKKLFKMDFIIAAVLVTPLFQTNGYRSYMGIIDPSITYTFFYALPCALLLLYFSPFILQYYHGNNLSLKLLIKILWIPFALLICLSGPLNPGIVLIFSILVFLIIIKKNYVQLIQKGLIKKEVFAIYRIPKNYWFYFIPLVIFSIYSLYLGRYNSNNINIPLKELFSRLPEGVYYQFTQKLGFPILFLVLTLNTILIKNNFKTLEGKKILTIFKWIGIFTLLYILLLPFGGFRDYRPNTLRYDTIMPITLCLIFIFGSTTLFIIKSMTTKQKLWYIPIVIGVLFVYTNSDEAKFDLNKCEKIALKTISESKEKVVQLQNDCTVLSWNKIEKAEDSDLNAQLLIIWRITKDKKLYFNKYTP